jgi:hypothetical protein
VALDLRRDAQQHAGIIGVTVPGERELSDTARDEIRLLGEDIIRR